MTEKPTIEGKDLLTHARTMFVYHAGQRLNSTRYFFAIYGVIFGGYLTILKDNEIDSILQHKSLAAIAVFGALVATVYWLLDFRNAELVHVDENAMHYIERQLAGEYTASETVENHEYPNQRLVGLYETGHPILIARNMDKAPKKRRLKIPFTYANIMPFVFGVLTVIPIIAFGYHVTNFRPQ